jgi:E3 ubiquitin-protein ligase mind-bomb
MIFFSKFKCLGATGIVTGIDQDSDIEVTYSSGNKWTFNPAVLTVANSTASTTNTDSLESRLHQIKIDSTCSTDKEFSINDLVEVTSNLEQIKVLQSGHGEWAEAMLPV